jgi:hypothetical protein
MYDRSDPRSSLRQSGDSAPAPSQLASAEFGLFYKDPPNQHDANGRTWFCRGQNFVVAYSELKPGAVLECAGQPDEYMLLLPDADTPVVASAGAQEERSDGYALLVLPPGQSRLSFPEGGVAIRLFSTQSPDLNANCANAASYDMARPNIPEFQSWPLPPDGYKIRVYSLDVPPKPGRFGRIFRCTTLMINLLGPNVGPRDTTKVSPHHHDDFEQGSLALKGSWRHHLRWPWVTNMNEWREDLHAAVEAPSLTIIPPPVIHTSTWLAPENLLLDIYAPPRVDFSEKPGWVLNGDDYPMPKET